MSWPRDDAKLERVRALMAEEELDALVVRAPDDVLYLTGFWGMKGYDACVFPREGAPVLITIEASEEDAARTAWTEDVRLIRGYDPEDPRPPLSRTLDAAVAAARDYERVGLELSLGTQASDRMVGEPTTFTAAWFGAFPEAADATPLLVRARSLKTEQEVERLRLANEIAAAAMEHVRANLRCGMREAQAASLWQGFVHGEGTGWRGKVELALPFSLVWAGQGIKTFTATGDRTVVEGEPVLFEIWVCADGYWADHTKNLVLGELKPEYAELESALMGVYERALESIRPGASMAELDRGVREEIAAMGYPGQPTHPICHGVGARAHEPPYPHQAGGGEFAEGMVLAVEPGCLLAGRRWSPRRGQLPRHRGRGREALLVPRRGGGVSDLIWTGALNDGFRIGGRVGLYDTTLRDGEQTVGVVLSPEEKLEIARLLDGLGVERIEAGFPRVSEDDRRAVELVAGAGLHAEVWGFSRAVPADLELLVELGVGASVIESPISDLKLEAIGVDRETMLGRITSAMRFATEHGIRAAFFGVDSTRAEPDFYERVYASAVEAGAREVVVVDTLGIASPEAVAELVGRTVETVGRDVPVHFHGHDDFGLATASAVAAVRAGATWIHGTINGMGERAGNADLGEIALALRALYGVETGLRLDRIRDAAARVQELAGYELPPWKPLTGETLFRRESGAVASQFHDPPSIEPYSSDLVAAERGIVLGKKSGLDSIRIKAEELGLDVPEERRAELLAQVKELGTRKRGLVSDDEFRQARQWLTTTPSSSGAASIPSPARRCSRERGWRVCVLERNEWLGGAIKTEELTEPGFLHDVFSAWHPLWVGGAAHAELGEELAARGLEYLNTDLPTASAYPDGSAAFLLRTAEANAAELGPEWTGVLDRFLPERRSRLRRPRDRALVAGGPRSRRRERCDGSAAPARSPSSATCSSRAGTGSRRRSLPSARTACSPRGCCTPGSAPTRPCPAS